MALALAWMRRPATSGLLLLLASLAALGLANGAWGARYAETLHAPLTLGPAAWGLTLSLQHWVNDALMSVFFMHVSLEIRHELTHGALHPWRRALAPGIAALGGMIVPAVIFLACSWGQAGLRRGWAVPVATDIAFSLAVLAALGHRVAPGIKAFLTALAVLDDLLAIAIIALFYGEAVAPLPLAAAGAILAGIFALSRARLRHARAYLLLYPLLWLAVLKSGLHATLAGVAFAMVLPDQPRTPRHLPPTAAFERVTSLLCALLVLPAFGLANAGISLGRLAPGTLQPGLILGIMLGLAAGKPLGVMAACEIASRLGLAQLPDGIGRRDLLGAAFLCGIGFTISLFIATLAFPPGPLRGQAKLAVFAASLLSAAIGAAVLWRAGPRGQL